MNYISIGILGFTALALLFGALVGMLRGRNRAALRLGLVILSVILAVLLRGTVANLLLGVEIGGESLEEMVMTEMASGEDPLPEALVNLVFALLEIIIGLVAFFAIFVILRLFTWAIVFPILKIFVKKGENKGAGLGALFGLAQGLVVAFVICAPVTGIVLQVDRLSQIELDGERLIEIPEEIGISEFASSASAKVYSSAGGWFFDAVSSTTDANGNKVSIDDTCAILETVVGIADTATQLTESIDRISKEDATPEERIDALRDIGKGLSEVGGSIDSLSGDAKALIDDLAVAIKDIVADEGEDMPPEIAEILDNFSIDDLKLDSAGQAISGIATYIEKTNEDFGSGEAVTEEEISDIVNGLADNTFILDLLDATAESEGGEIPALLEVGESDRAIFESAISDTELSSEQKDLLRGLFGLS